MPFNVVLVNIVNRFERKGLKLIGMKMLALGDDVLEEHYAHVADKPFFPACENL